MRLKKERPVSGGFFFCQGNRSGLASGSGLTRRSGRSIEDGNSPRKFFTLMNRTVINPSVSLNISTRDGRANLTVYQSEM